MHVKDPVAGPNKKFGLTVATQTPLHVQRVLPPRQRHFVDLPVASNATDSFVHMNAVVEIDIVRQAVHANPFDGSIFSETLPDRLEHRTVRPNLGMAIHAGLGRRYARKRAVLNRRMTVAAVDTKPADMMFVAERNRLHARNTSLGHIRRSDDLSNNYCESGDNEDSTEDADL